jgi:hypothetical protein
MLKVWLEVWWREVSVLEVMGDPVIMPLARLNIPPLPEQNNDNDNGRCTYSQSA